MTTYIDSWYTSREENKQLFGSEQMPITMKALRTFQQKFGTGNLCKRMNGYDHR